MTNLSPHFTWTEVERSATAKAKAIDNRVPVHLTAFVGRMAEAMEHARALLGHRPLHVTSWYRCEALNTAIGGSETSAHVYGLACDFKVAHMPLEEAFAALGESSLPFDQLIIERTNDGAHWLHMGLSTGKPRRERLKARGQLLGGVMTFRRVVEG